MAALALVADLMLQSQLSAAAARVGADVGFVTSAATLLAKAEADAPGLVIIDLSSGPLDLAAIVEQLRTSVPGVSILAFGPHVHKERLAAASAASCDAVISRGQFHAEMDAILASGAAQ